MSEFAFPASKTTHNGVSTVTAFNADADQPLFIADSRHPHWNDILEGLRVGDPNVWSLFDVAKGIMNRFEQVTDRVSFNGSEVLFDGDPVHSVLTDQLRRAIDDGHTENYKALALFWEKLESNPCEHSREQAYDFLATHAFQITETGDVVGYKGMRLVDTKADGTEIYSSIAHSQVKGVPSAFVNGVAQPELSTVRQSVGDVVSMPRSEVTHDPSKSCERGLHVATRSYAASYGTVMEVHFNPRDLVSVPTADGGKKVRVHKYKNARLAVNETTGPVLRESSTPKWAGDVSTRVD